MPEPFLWLLTPPWSMWSCSSDLQWPLLIALGQWEVELGRGCLFWGWSRVQWHWAADDHGPLPLSTTQVTQGFGGAGLAKWREWGETPLPTGYRKVQMTPPVSFHPAETSHAFLIFSLTWAFSNIWNRTVKSGKKECCQTDTVQKRI